MRAADKDILRIALPAIVSNVTVPLLSMVDTSIVGHLGSAAYIGAVAVGGTVFSMVYWIFGFLRASTSGLTSQAFGDGDERQIRSHFHRSVFFAMLVASFMIVFQRFLWDGSLLLIPASSDVERFARQYFSICVWGAPAVMLTWAFNGWFLGMQNARIPMIVSIAQNVVNIPASLFLVFVLRQNVCGVALGTVIAQYAGLFLAVWLKRKYFRRYCSWRLDGDVFRWKEMKRFLNVNRDIFLRMVCLVAVMVCFTSAGARQGDGILAANTLLLQFFYMFSYVMDGFSNAGEAVCGKYYGAGDVAGIKMTVRTLFRWGVVLAVFFTFLYFIGGTAFLHLLTNDREVLCTASRFFGWTLLIPLCGFSAFLWDGVYIGTTSTLSMLLSMLVAVLVFFLGWAVLGDSLRNDALWLAFLLYLLTRGLMQTVLYGRIVADVKAGDRDKR